MVVKTLFFPAMNRWAIPFVRFADLALQSRRGRSPVFQDRAAETDGPAMIAIDEE